MELKDCDEIRRCLVVIRGRAQRLKSGERTREAEEIIRASDRLEAIVSREERAIKGREG